MSADNDASVCQCGDEAGLWKLKTYPPGTRVRVTITLRCGDGLRDVTAIHHYAEWFTFVNDILASKPTLFGVTDENDEIIGEEQIRDPGLIVNISSRLILPALDVDAATEEIET